MLSGKPNPDSRKPINVQGLKLFLARESGDVPLSRLCEIYLVLRALGNDPIARELLDATGTRIHDIDGKLIYPVER